MSTNLCTMTPGHLDSCLASRARVTLAINLCYKDSVSNSIKEEVLPALLLQNGPKRCLKSEEPEDPHSREGDSTFQAYLQWGLTLHFLAKWQSSCVELNPPLPPTPNKKQSQDRRRGRGKEYKNSVFGKIWKYFSSKNHQTRFLCLVQISNQRRKKMLSDYYTNKEDVKPLQSES